jgi:hypothetical protein
MIHHNVQSSGGEEYKLRACPDPTPNPHHCEDCEQNPCGSVRFGLFIRFGTRVWVNARGRTTRKQEGGRLGWPSVLGAPEL